MMPQSLRSLDPRDDPASVDIEQAERPERLLRLFVSLPAYAQAERRLIGQALADLNKTFAGAVRIAPLGSGIEAAAAEDGALGAADCDAVIAVLRPRLPTDEPELAGQAGARGGAAGLVSAMGQRKDGAGLPDVYIFRYAESPDQAANDADWQSGKRAFDSWFRARGGQVLGFDDFTAPAAFGDRLDERLRAWLARLGFAPPPAGEVVLFEPEIIEPVAHAIIETGAEEIGEASILEAPEAAEIVAEPVVFEPRPAFDDAKEAVRQDRFRRLTNFLNRRETAFTPADEPVEAALADLSPGAASAVGHAEALAEEPEVLSDPEEAPPEAPPDVEAATVSEAEVEPEPGETVPADILVEEEDPAVAAADRLAEEPGAISEPEAAWDQSVPEADSGREGAPNTEIVGDPVLDTLDHVEETVPEDAEAAPAELPKPLAESGEPWAEVFSATAVPVFYEREPVIDLVPDPSDWRRRAVLLAMTVLTAGSLAAIVFAGLQWRAAVSRADQVQWKLAATTDTAGNLVFELMQESRRVGGAISEGSKAIVDQAQKLHGELLTAGAFNSAELFAQANSRMNTAEALYKQNKLAEALASVTEGQKLFLTLTDAEPNQLEWQGRLGASDEKLGDLLVAQNNLTEALGAYRDSMAIYRALSLKAPDNVDIRRRLSVAQQMVGDVLAVKGRLDDALAAYREAVAIIKTLAQTDAANPERQRDLLQIDNKIGDVLSAQNHLDDALVVYREALALAGKMSLMNPADPNWREASSQTDNKIGDVLVGKERIDDALAAYREALATMKDVAANDPGNSEWPRVIAATHKKIGDAFVTEAHFESALASYRDALTILQALSAKDPANAAWRYGMSEVDLKIGQVLFNQNNLDGALAAHRDSLTIMKALATEDPGNARYQHDLMMDNNDIGLLMNQKGDHADALAAYREAQAIAVAMGKKDPRSPDWQSTRAMIDNNMGALLIDQGHRDEAITAYRDGLNVSKGLVAIDPRSVEWQTGLVVAMYNLGEAGEDSETNFTQAKELLTRLDNAGVLRPDKRALIAKVDEALAKLDGAGARSRPAHH